MIERLTALRRAVVACVLLAALTLIATPSAKAHANLVTAKPAAGSSLSAAPSQVELWFSERPEPRLSFIHVLNSQGQRVDEGGPSAVANEPLSLAENLAADLPNGLYSVNWQTTSAGEGHVTGGSFSFGVGVAPGTAKLTAAAESTPPAVNWSAAVIRWLNDLAVLLLFGVVSFEPVVLQHAFDWKERAGSFVIEQTVAVTRRCQRLASGLAGLGLFAVAAAAAEQAWRSTNGPSEATLGATLHTYVGGLLICRLAAALAIFGLLLGAGLPAHSMHKSLGAAAAAVMRRDAIIGLNRRWLLPTLVLLEVSLLALSSHAVAISTTPELLFAVDALHLALGGAWSGGLVALVLAVVPIARMHSAGPGVPTSSDFLRPVINLFSRLALLAVAGLGLTGAFMAQVQLGRLDMLLASPYGWAMVVKATIVVGALGLAAGHRFVLLPMLNGTQRVRTGSKWFTLGLPAEACLGVAILAAASLLANFSPPSDNQAPKGAVTTAGASQSLSELSALPQPDDFTLGAQAGDALVGMTLRPGQPGKNQVLLYVLPKAGERAADSQSVVLEIAGQTVPLQQCAATCRVAIAQLTGGETIRVQVGDDPQATAVFQIPRLPAISGRQLFQQAQSRMGQLNSLQIEEMTGPAGSPLRTIYTLQAPDRLIARASSGEEFVSIGTTRFDRQAPDQPWQASAALEPLKVPSFMWDALPAQSPYLIGTAGVDGSGIQTLAFFEFDGHTPTWFQLWVDDSGAVQRMEMQAPRHSMVQQYHELGAPVFIEAPKLG